MFVTLEGIDGSGKSTLAGALASRYPAGGRHPFSGVTYSFQPWSNSEAAPTTETSALLGKLYETVKAQPDPAGLGYLVYMIMDRFAQGFDLDLAKQQSHSLFIWDRFIDSTTAYQGATLSKVTGDDLSKWVNILDTFQRTLFPRPDLTLYLAVSAEVAQTRKAKEDNREIVSGDRIEFGNLVNDCYEELYLNHNDDGRIVLLDGTLSPEELVVEATKAISMRFGQLYF